MKRNHFRQKALLTKTLRRLYTVPAPERKDAFFQSSAYRAAASEALYPPRVPWAAFLQTQMHYIRKWNWILAVCIFAAAILLTLQPWQTAAPQEDLRGLDLSTPVILSACIPFLALATIAEAGRSAQFGMEELELSARFSLQAVLCARLSILGGGNLLLLTILMPFGTYFWGTGLSMTAACILLPYLLTCALTLPAVRKLRGKDCTILCAGISALVSLSFLTADATGFLDRAAAAPALIPAALLFFGTAAVLELRKYIRQSEELTWNFTLTG